MTKPLLVIGNKKYSSWSLRPWLLLKHLNARFDEVRIPLDTPEFLSQVSQYSGAGRVPVYVEGDKRIWDSLSIAEYLAEAHPQLWPLDPNARAFARSMVAEMHSGFTGLRSALPMNCSANQRVVTLSSSALSDIQRIENIWMQCAHYADGKGPWLFGTFSIADAFFAPVVVRFQGYQLELGSETKRYCETQLANPHLQQWIAAGQAESEVLESEEAGQIVS